MARISLILLMLAAACTEPRSKRCTDVCAREAACHDELEREENFDEGECLDACVALERDSEARVLVEAHAECVAAAGDSCEAVVSCD
jgi:hypothetical protein